MDTLWNFGKISKSNVTKVANYLLVIVDMNIYITIFYQIFFIFWISYIPERF